MKGNAVEARRKTKGDHARFGKLHKKAEKKQ